MFQIFLLLVIIGLVLFVVGFFTFLVSCVIFAKFQNSAQKWIENKNDELHSEFRKYDLIHYHEGQYKVLYFSGVGYYITSRTNSERTKALSPSQFRKVIFKLYDTPVDDVIVPLFEEYKAEINLKEQKRLEKIYSKNKKERKIQFMPNKKEEQK